MTINFANSLICPWKIHFYCKGCNSHDVYFDCMDLPEYKAYVEPVKKALNESKRIAILGETWYEVYEFLKYDILNIDYRKIIGVVNFNFTENKYAMNYPLYTFEEIIKEKPDLILVIGTIPEEKVRTVINSALSINSDIAFPSIKTLWKSRRKALLSLYEREDLDLFLNGRNIMNSLKKALHGIENIVMYGAGWNAQKLEKHLKEAGGKSFPVSIAAVVDDNPSPDKYLFGIKVDYPREEYFEEANAVFITCADNKYVFDIEKKIKNKNKDMKIIKLSKILEKSVLI